MIDGGGWSEHTVLNKHVMDLLWPLPLTSSCVMVAVMMMVVMMEMVMMEVVMITI